MLSHARPVESVPDARTNDWVNWAPVEALVFDVRQVCCAASPRSRLLFSAVEPVGLHLSAVFAEWTSVPRRALEGEQVSLLHHSDGRVFQCESSHAVVGESVLVLTDVTHHVRGVDRSMRDNLTGLIGRGALKEQLADLLATSRRDGTQAAVHFINLDRLRSVNDALGHPVGDVLLVKVAERLRSTLADGDVAARLGGDQFVVVQAQLSSLDDAQRRAARLTDLIGRTYVVNGHMLNIGASVGVAVFPDNGEEIDTLLRHADLAVHRAKAESRGGYRFYEPAMDARMQARRLLELDLRRAMTLRQFSLAFQPQVQLASNRITGFEALIRWTHPERGPISPADFIPVAEELGLIKGIGEWVLRTACREAAAWPVPATVAVNLSPVQFKGGDLVATVMSALSQSQLPPTRLELEITEGALLEETDLVVKALHEIRAFGVRISMDDFGTGYSSLSYLRKFPFDKIKIDRSFITGLGVSNDCDAIVRAIAGLGTSLGMRTTAEGVETHDQLARIRSEGLSEVQGYLTGKPLSPAEAAALLATESEPG